MSALCGPTKSDPTLRSKGSARCASTRAVRIRRSLRCVFGPGQIDADGKQVVAVSVARYIARMSDGSILGVPKAAPSFLT